MNKFKHFIGIDISKEYFDATILGESKQSSHNQFSNTKKGITQFLKWVRQEKCSMDVTLICMEYTGIYNKIILDILINKSFYVWVEMSYRIIRSSGIQRGKNDKIDSERIALYAKKNQEDAKIFKASDKVLDKIQGLLGQREMILSHKTALQVRTNELKVYDIEVYNVLSKNIKAIIRSEEVALKAIENQIDDLIKENQELQVLYNHITSVPGVGRVTALFLICFTNACTTYENPRQLASYCGVVPFEYTSGKSVRGRAKVHFMANKKLKKLLHLCALSSSKNDSEMKQYYDKKVAEGKSKMLVLNNVRNKLIHRICACVKNNRPYEIRLIA